MKNQNDMLRAVCWENGCLRLLDQRHLPHRHESITLTDVIEVAEAIRSMVVRGAPAIGIAAAYGVVLAARQAYVGSTTDWRQRIQPALKALANSRPTAVNLFWALQRMEKLFDGINGDPEPALLREAQAIQQADIDANLRMGELGAALLPTPCQVLTHCNAGALATGGYGTALGVVRSAFTAGKLTRVYADETRPWLQGARLTAWELMQDNIPVTLLADSAAAMLMRRGLVDWVIVGADRITANGDVANKIGTYSLAVLARQHGVRFMVVAPSSTLDFTLDSGEQIEIEERTAEEIRNIAGQPIAPQQVDTWNPVFDVTPAELVDVIVTECGIVQQPTRKRMHTLQPTMKKS